MPSGKDRERERGTDEQRTRHESEPEREPGEGQRALADHDGLLDHLLDPLGVLDVEKRDVWDQPAGIWGLIWIAFGVAGLK